MKNNATIDERCGTYAGVMAHRRRFEYLCEACKESRRIKRREDERKARIEKPEMVAARKKRHRERKPEAPELGRIRNRRRRALLKSVPTENYTTFQIIDLYGTNCHICQEAIDFTASNKVGDKGWQLGLQLDHVIPISKSGADTLENVRPAHAICNIRKGDKLVDNLVIIRPRPSSSHFVPDEVQNQATTSSAVRISNTDEDAVSGWGKNNG